MVAYNLDHLTQGPNQWVYGPIQDDEALFLFAVVRGMRLRRILEIGGLQGYSAENFLRAVGPSGILYTVDINPVSSRAPNHRTLHKDGRHLVSGDLDGKPLDMIFFDCHSYEVQFEIFYQLQRENIITDRTVIALHDTNLHPRKFFDHVYPVDEGFVHQKAERKMVNDFHRLGYDAFCLHTDMAVHDETLPARHGVTVMTKFRPLAV